MRISDWSSDVCSSDLTDCHRHRCSRHFISRSYRLVVIADGVGDFLRQSLGAGIISAHNALKFRELSNHFSDEISLAETGGLLGHIRQTSAIRLARTNNAFFNQPARQFGDAVDLVGDCAQRSEEHTSELQSLMRLSSAV